MQMCSALPKLLETNGRSLRCSSQMQTMLLSSSCHDASPSWIITCSRPQIKGLSLDKDCSPHPQSSCSVSV